jgi:hypothetical protein
VAGGVAATTGSGESQAAPAGRFGAAAPQQNPNTQQVMFGGEKGAARLAGPEDAPSWVKSLAPSQIGPGQPVRVAQDMAEAGHNADSIFQSTGWYRAPDGQWKWILRDDDSKLNRNAFDVRPGSPASVSQQTSPTGQPVIAKRDAVPDIFTLKPSMVGATLGSVFDSPNLYQTYPELRNAKIDFLRDNTDPAVRASYNDQTNTVKLNRNGNTEQEIIGDLTHELQHGIQDKHGEGTFGQGGSDQDARFYPDDFDKQAKAARESLDAASDAVKKAGADPDTLYSGWRVMMQGQADKYPAMMRAYFAEMRKLPEDVNTQFTRAAVASDSIRFMRKDAFDKYERLAGETEARQASEQRITGNYQLPSRMPGYAPGSEQLVDTGHGPLLKGRNFQFTPVEHDPFSAPAEAGTPMKLTPVDDDPHKFDAEDPQYYNRNFERNSQWLAPGEHNYNTQLNPQEEDAFRRWMKDNKVPFKPDEKVTDYDMRGFYKALQVGDPTAVQAVDPNDNRMHFPDKWKTPYAATFSDQSQWADPSKAPGWQGDQYVGKDGVVYYDDKSGHWVGPDAPWSPSPGATPLQLSPVDHDPYAPQPPQQQAPPPLPVAPTPPSAALSPTGPLKWSWGNEYAAPAPNDPSEPQNIALNIMQPKDYPNYAQAY